MKPLLCLLVVVSAALLPSAQAQRGVAATVETIFFDDFSGPALDRTKWNVIVTGRTVNNEQQAYVDSPETIRFTSGNVDGPTNGALLIQPRFRQGFMTPEGRSFDFISGRLESRGKFEFTYGTIAARIKLTAGSGLWPAFWLLGTGRWPATGEIDIMENVGEPDWTNIAIHGPGYSGNTPLYSRATFTPAADVSAWHVYSVDWSSDAMVFKVDDREIYRATKPQIEKYGEWAFDNPKFLIVNFAIGGQYPQSVNKTTQPYLGLPAATVDLIKSDKAGMLVDWVRVTK
jgi:beta-glucanase (GH16 family)